MRGYNMVVGIGGVGLFNRFKFLPLDFFTDGVIDLYLVRCLPAVPSKALLPSYHYCICEHGLQQPAGRIDVRIGLNDQTRYVGHIGYNVSPPYRGNHYALRACRLVRKVAQAHGMTQLIITCNPDNLPSKRTCEGLGAKLLEVVALPVGNLLYQRGERHKCVFQWQLDAPDPPITPHTALRENGQYATIKPADDRKDVDCEK